MKNLFLKITCLFLICICSLFVPTTYAESPTINDPLDKKSNIQQIGPDEYKIGGIMLNKKKKEIHITGSINMQSGLVEYLACQDEVGKLHESVLKLDAKPSDIQVALLLLGFKNKNNLEFQGDSTIPEGDPLDVFVEWNLPDKSTKKVRAEELVFDQQKNKAMEKTYWVFTGSKIIDGQFMADMDGSIIATFRDPLAIINNPLPTGADDTVYVSNEKLLPPNDTKVHLVIKAAEKVLKKNSSPAKDKDIDSIDMNNTKNNKESKNPNVKVIDETP
ncbi:MAG: YdjY domain-containing protein [bacterium]